MATLVPAAEAVVAAREAGLRYVRDTKPGITRHRAGKGFSYRQPDGSFVTDDRVLARIRALAVPPAYTDVWISNDPLGHIQATGRDARGRKQYRYHPRWRAERDGNKYDRLAAFAGVLPKIRRRVARDLRSPRLTREKVLAAIVRLLEETRIRIGNESYAKQNRSFGLTTLRNRHAEVNGSKVQFEFVGKGGKKWQVELHDRRLARIVRSCQALPGQDLFEYVDAGGIVRAVGSADVNAYLREISGQELTAKEFRTWAGTVLAASALRYLDAAQTKGGPKRRIRGVIEEVAEALGNTVAICRKCYIHPRVIEAYLDGSLGAAFASLPATDHPAPATALSAAERVVLALLRRRRAAKGDFRQVLEASLRKAA
jgi:DNA topoisomerase I